MRAAAVLGWTAGLGFGLPCVYAIWYFADRGRVWIFLGFPTYGEGPFEDIGIETTTTLLAAFLLVCVAELIAGWMLWQGRRAGVMLAIALLPVEFVFWIGFALPFGPILGVARTGVMIVAITRGVAGQQPPVKARRDPADAPRSCRSRRDSGPQPSQST